MLRKTIFACVFAVINVVAISFSFHANAYQISVKQKPGKLRFSVIEENSIYERAGFKRNDIIRSVNGKAVDDSTSLEVVDNVIRKGGRIKIERDGKMIFKKLKPMPQDFILIDPEGDSH